MEGARALLPAPGGLGWEQGDRWGPAGVQPPVPDLWEDEREEQGEVVAPEPVAMTAAAWSGAWRAMALRMLLPFIPGEGQREEEREGERGREKEDRGRRDGRKE